MLDKQKIYYNIPTDKPFIRCDYGVAKRPGETQSETYVHLYLKINVIEKELYLKKQRPIDIIKINRDIRKELGVEHIQYKRMYDINYTFINGFKDIKQHYYSDDNELDKINIGDDVYLLREYNTTYKRDCDQYQIYDAVCIRKIGNYVEWHTTSQANCNDSILNNYLRKKKYNKLFAY